MIVTTTSTDSPGRDLEASICSGRGDQQGPRPAALLLPSGRSLAATVGSTVRRHVIGLRKRPLIAVRVRSGREFLFLVVV
jgi:hypothetical protein